MLRSKSFCSINDLTKDELTGLIDLSSQLKNEKKNGFFPKRLNNKNIALIFQKTSTRTRCAFAIAASDEGAHAEYLNTKDIQLGEKESIKDTARVLGRFFDGIQFRGFRHLDVVELAQYAGVPVWNGLTDEEHPTQTLADLATLQEYFGRLKNLRLVYLGDARNNVARSLMHGCAHAGLHLTLSSPEFLRPPSDELQKYGVLAKQNSGSLLWEENPWTAVKHADALYTDVWVSMGEENLPGIQERIASLKDYQVNKNLFLATENNNCVFLHCLPARKGWEVSEEIFEHKNSLVFDQAENRLHTIKALMVSSLT